MLVGFKQKRRNQHDIGHVLAGRLQLAFQFFANNRVQQMFQPTAFFRGFEHNLPEPAPIQGAITREDAPAKMLRYPGKCWRARFNHLPGDIVRVYPVHAQLAEQPCHRGFTGANAACQTNHLHTPSLGSDTQITKPERLDFRPEPEAQQAGGSEVGPEGNGHLTAMLAEYHQADTHHGTHY